MDLNLGERQFPGHLGRWLGRQRGDEEDTGLGGGLKEMGDGLSPSPQWPVKPSNQKG